MAAAPAEPSAETTPQQPVRQRGLRPPSWRALAIFWVIVLAAGGATGVALVSLGPPPPPRLAQPAPPPPALRLAGPDLPDPHPPAPASPAGRGEPAVPPPTASADPLTGPPTAAGPAAPPAPANAIAAGPAAPPPGTVTAHGPGANTGPATPPGPTAPPGTGTPPGPATRAVPGAPAANTAATPPPPGGPTSPIRALDEPPVAAPLAAPLPAAPPPPPPAAAEPPPPPSPPPQFAERVIPAADPALLEPGAHGPLPRVGADGRTPIRVYARGMDRQDGRPRVGLVLGGLGANARLAEQAIARLPGGITLAFSPYAARLEPLLERARARGMEMLVALPLEPTGYPLDSPGNRALLTTLAPAENQDRLDWVLSRFTGYVGAVGALGPLLGERYAALSERMGALEESLRSRGLLYVDPRPGARGPGRAWGRVVDVVIDRPATRTEIERNLAELERLARERGSALGYAGEASPVLLDRVAAWASTVETRGLVLAPVTALMRRPEAPATEPPARTARAP